MQKISNTAELKASIRELELKTQRQEALLKEDAKGTLNSFKPTNLLKSGIQQIRTTSPDVKTTALNTFVGLAAGFITRRLVLGKNPNILRRTLGAAVQAGITRYVYKSLPAWQNKIASLQENKQGRKPVKVLSSRS